MNQRSMICHYHEEKTPSLLLKEDGTFQCLSCGAHGKWVDDGDTVKLERDAA